MIVKLCAFGAFKIVKINPSFIFFRYLVVRHADGSLRARHELSLRRQRDRRCELRHVHRVPTGLLRTQDHQHVRVPRDAFRQKDQIARLPSVFHRYRE